jgi:hypothetical protein
MSGADEYGVLTTLVKTIGFLVSAAAAIWFAWRKRANWEPSEEDVPKGAHRLAGLATVVGIAILYGQLANPENVPVLIQLSLVNLTVAIVALSIYSLLIGTLIYIKRTSDRRGRTKEIRIIGGFWLTREARIAKQTHKVTTQKLLEGAAYDPDLLWARLVRSSAKLTFMLSYIALNAAGSLSLTCAGILLLLKGTAKGD